MVFGQMRSLLDLFLEDANEISITANEECYKQIPEDSLILHN